MRIIAMANQKGGVGKTTSSVNISAALVELGKKVLVIDLDPQGNLTDSFGYDADDLEKTVFNVLDKKPMEEVILSTKGLDLVPANIELSNADLHLAQRIGRENLLRRAIHNLKEDYDFVIIDCPPNLNVLTINAFSAATDIIIPVQTEYFAMKGLKQLLVTINAIQEEVNPELKISGIISTMYNSSKNLSKDVVANIESNLPGQLFNTPIRSNVKLAEAPSQSMTIFEYAPDSNGAKDYLDLTKEIIERG